MIDRRTEPNSLLRDILPSSKHSSTLSLPLLVMLAAASGSALEQLSVSRPQFEVASIKLRTDSEHRVVNFQHVEDILQDTLPVGAIGRDHARVLMRNQSLTNLIAAAYRVRRNQVIGPAWLSDQRFDVEAIIPAGAATDQVNEMLQDLLEQRFGLQVHRESRMVSGYELIVGKNGPKMEESSLDPTPERPADPQNAAAGKRELKLPAIRNPHKGLVSVQHAATTERLAETLSRLVHAAVVDKTALKGKYDVELETVPDLPDRPGISVFEAVEKLGLKLQPHKVPFEAVVVDQATKIPTPN